MWIVLNVVGCWSWLSCRRLGFMKGCLEGSVMNGGQAAGAGVAHSAMRTKQT